MLRHCFLKLRHAHAYYQLRLRVLFHDVTLSTVLTDMGENRELHMTRLFLVNALHMSNIVGVISVTE